MSKFDGFTTYEWIHSESYNVFERSLIRKTLAASPPKDGFAVDIGCGPGLVLIEMCHLFRRCIGVDISPGILKRARDHIGNRRRSNVDLLCADTEFLPFRDSVFVVATMYSVLHHLPNLNGSLVEIVRTLSAGSELIVFHEPNLDRARRTFEKTLMKLLRKVRGILLRSLYKKMWGNFKREAELRFGKLGQLEALADLHSKKGFSAAEIRMLMEKSGFQVVTIKPRTQSFMATFSRLHWPYKSVAALDFILGELPILKEYLPLLLCVAKKKEVSPV